MSGVVVGETLRRQFTSSGYWAFVALLAIVALGISRFNAPGSMWPSLVALLAFIIGCTPIGPEFSSGTLQLILTKPINRSVYLLSRVAGAVCAVWTATLIAGLVEFAGRALWGDLSRASLLGAAIVNSLADTVLVCALLVLLGSVTRAYFNIAIYLAAMFGLGILQAILGMFRAAHNAFGEWLTATPAVERSLAAISQNLFPDAPPRIDRGWLLLVFSNAAIALVLACFAFRQREVPYGAD